VAPGPPSSASPTSKASQLKPTTKYIFRTFDAPGAGTGFFQGTIPAGILPDGTISGSIYDTNSAFHSWVRAPNGSITTLADAPGSGTGAIQGTAVHGMNSAGAMTGAVIDASSTVHGFLRSPDGTYTLFDAPGAGIGEPGSGSDLTGTHGFCINNKGEIAGNYWDVNLLPHAFIRAPNGTITTFDAPGAGSDPSQGQGTFYAYSNYQFFYCLNSAGTYTSAYTDSDNGGHGFLRAPNGAFTTFDPPGAGKGAYQGTVAISINPAGQIAGSYVDENYVGYGFVRDKSGKFTTFAVPGQGTTFGQYQGVVVNNNNPAGAVAGWYNDANTVAHGFVRTITTFDAPGADTVDLYHGTLVTGLNPAGLLTGYGWDENMVAHGFVAVPAIFAGKPGYTNCPGQSTAAITKQYGSLLAGARALSFPDVQSLLNAIQAFCGQ
jgi:hypothetical protein